MSDFQLPQGLSLSGAALLAYRPFIIWLKLGGPIVFCLKKMS